MQPLKIVMPIHGCVAALDVLNKQGDIGGLIKELFEQTGLNGRNLCLPQVLGMSCALSHGIYRSSVQARDEIR